jgi:sulfonate transport system substrate-binding protein
MNVTVMKINVTGVPEHFNLPWKLCVEENLFSDLGVEVIWTDEPSGTGAICSSLQNGKADLAVSLTEGIILDIARGNPATILDVFVKSPLIWGIHTSADRIENQIQDFSKPIYAISRFQSGSHLIAKLECTQRNKTIDDSQWKEVRNVQGAIDSLSKHETDIFFWEKFITSPWTEKKILKRIGEFPTPWPCLVFVANNHFLEKHSELTQKTIRTVQFRAQKLQNDPNLPNLVSKRFGLTETHAQAWCKAVQWNTRPYPLVELNSIKNRIINSIS